MVDLPRDFFLSQKESLFLLINKISYFQNTQIGTAIELILFLFKPIQNKFWIPFIWNQSVLNFLKERPQLVDVDASILAVKQKLKDHNELQLVAKQGEINRVGLIIKRIEEETKCTIKSMKTSSQKQTITDEKGQKKEVTSLYLRTVFVKN